MGALLKWWRSGNQTVMLVGKLLLCTVVTQVCLHLLLTHIHRVMHSKSMRTHTQQQWKDMACCLRGWNAEMLLYEMVCEVWWDLTSQCWSIRSITSHSTLPPFALSIPAPEEYLGWGVWWWGYSFIYDTWTHTWTFLTKMQNGLKLERTKELYQQTSYEQRPKCIYQDKTSSINGDTGSISKCTTWTISQFSSKLSPITQLYQQFIWNTILPFALLPVLCAVVMAWTWKLVHELCSTWEIITSVQQRFINRRSQPIYVKEIQKTTATWLYGTWQRVCLLFASVLVAFAD